MKKLSIIILSIFVIVLGAPMALAQDLETGLEPGTIPAESFYRGQVIRILEENSQELEGNIVLNQKVLVKITSGDKKDQEIQIDHNGLFTSSGGKGVKAGDKIVVYGVNVQGEEVFYIADSYRIPALLTVVFIFFLVAIAFARWKGLTSILGLIVSIAVIVLFIVPRILAGDNPVIISLLGALVIALVSIYLSHGFNRRTSVALAGTLIALGISALLSYLFVYFSSLFGIGSEEAFYLQISSVEAINMRGLLLGGIILGVLGVLDDVTTTQSATVEELKRANPDLNFTELYKRGLSVGREHIASLVNTLFLAYIGASLPLFLLFTTTVNQPLWVTLNSESIGEEIVRTMVGSIGLILAVPITTMIAAYYFSKQGAGQIDKNNVGHRH